MRTDMHRTASGAPARPSARASRRWSLPYAAACIAGQLLFANLALAVSLDDAVNRQLAFDQPSGNVCVELLGNDPISVLVGALRDNICGRPTPTPGSPPSSALGGGAGTPTTVPGILQQRLRELLNPGPKPIVPAPVGRLLAAPASSTKDTYAFAAGSVFALFEQENLDRAAAPSDAAYRSDVSRLTLGTEFRLSPRSAAGVAFEGARQTGAFDKGGDFELDSNRIFGVYAAVPVDPVFVQLYAGYGRDHYERTRYAEFTEDFQVFGSGFLRAKHSADQTSAGLLGAYDYWHHDARISPFVALDWKRIRFDRYAETGTSGLELIFYDDKQSSLQGSVGVQAQRLWSLGSLGVAPLASARWVHEFENDQRTIQVSFVQDTRAKRFTYQTDPPDRGWGELSIGITLFLPRSVQLFGAYRTIFSNSVYTSRTALFGARLSF